MADKKRILVVTQEFHPYTTATDIANIVSEYAQYMQENGTEVRILMPRFGSINERRHRLHEVVRLSGMNITVDDEDYPLVIKVASLPGTRMQIYFLDNDEFFKRKQMFKDKEAKPFEDNLDRTIFFCKGVIETVKKFGWAPDIVHCHGWMTSLLPAYLKGDYKNEPIFQNARFIYSVYPGEPAIESQIDTIFEEKASGNLFTKETIAAYKTDKGYNLNAGGIAHADGVILVDQEAEAPSNSNAALLEDGTKQEEGDWTHYMDFFDSLLLETEEEGA